MRITFVADYRSPTARQWIGWMQERHDVQVISSRRLADDDASTDGIRQEHEPLGPPAVLAALGSRLSRTSSQRRGPVSAVPSGRFGRKPSSAMPGVQRLVRVIGPLELPLHTSRLRARIDRFDPELIHAMRIPFEGMAASSAARGQPLLTSIWGNDLTMHAPANRLMARLTRKVLRRADALLTDCQRDRALAIAKWGWKEEKPSLIVPGAGGINGRLFRPDGSTIRESLGIPRASRVILNPRGIREYTCTLEFLEVVDELLCQRADVHVIATGMRRHAVVADRVARMPGRERVHLLPDLSHSEMADVYRAADVMVSLTTHDGTPNSLLEALACGCVPVVSPVKSVLEWVEHGLNGLVVDPDNTREMVDALIRALDDDALRARAITINLKAVEERAEYNTSMLRAETFYSQVLSAE